MAPARAEASYATDPRACAYRPQPLPGREQARKHIVSGESVPGEQEEEHGHGGQDLEQDIEQVLEQEQDLEQEQEQKQRQDLERRPGPGHDAEDVFLRKQQPGGGFQHRDGLDMARLPSDLLPLILAKLRFRLGDLAACARVSSWWNRVAQPLLYERVVL